jgi:hypothetical protein
MMRSIAHSATAADLDFIKLRADCSWGRIIPSVLYNLEKPGKMILIT